MTVDALEAYLEAGRTRRLAEYLDFLRIPSISTDPAYAADCRRAADWLVERLRAMGTRARRGLRDRRPSDRVRRLAPRRGRSHRGGLRALRRPAGRPARRMDLTAVRAGRGRRAGPRPGGERRQVERDDHAPGRRGAPRHARRAAGQPALRLRGRGGVVVPPSRAVAPGEPGAPGRRRGDRQRRRVLRGQPAGADRGPARPDVRPDRGDRSVPGPPLGCLRRDRRQPGERARLDHRRAQGCRRAHPGPRVLRRCRRARRRGPVQLRGAAVRRGDLPGEPGRARARGRGGLHDPRAEERPADPRRQRDLGRLPGRGLEDDHPRPGGGQGQLPTGGRPGSPTGSSSSSEPTSWRSRHPG